MACSVYRTKLYIEKLVVGLKEGLEWIIKASI